MKFTEQLKKKIGDEAFKAIEEELKGKELYLLDPKDYIPKEKFNTLLNEKKEFETSKAELEKQLNEAKTKLTDMEKNNSQNQQTVEQQIAELNKKITELSTAAENKEKELQRERRLSVLKDHLNESKVNPRYLKHALNEFDVDKLEIDDNGKIKGWDEIVKPVQETYPDFFGETRISGSSPAGGGSGDGAGSDEMKEQSTEEFLADVFSGEA